MSRLVVGTLALLLAPAAQAAAIGSWGVDLADQDRSVRPGDDFFRYQNGGWVARAAAGDPRCLGRRRIAFA